MKLLIPISLLILVIPAFAQVSQVKPPEVPVYGIVGPAGPFPFYNHGVLNLANADYTMTYPDMSAEVIRVMGNLTAQRTIIAPPDFGFMFTVENATTGGFPIVFKSSTAGLGTGAVIPFGQAVSIMNDGTNYVVVGSASSAGPVFPFHTAFGKGMAVDTTPPWSFSLPGPAVMMIGENVAANFSSKYYSTLDLESNYTNTSTTGASALVADFYTGAQISTTSTGYTALRGFDVEPGDYSNNSINDDISAGYYLAGSYGSANMGTVAGIYASGSPVGTGTTQQAWGVWGGVTEDLISGPLFGPITTGYNIIASGNTRGNIGTLYGFYSGEDVVGGTITNYYANYVAKPILNTTTPPLGTITNQYAFVSEPGSGHVGINTITPNAYLSWPNSVNGGGSYTGSNPSTLSVAEGAANPGNSFFYNGILSQVNVVSKVSNPSGGQETQAIWADASVDATTTQPASIWGIVANADDYSNAAVTNQEVAALSEGAFHNGADTVTQVVGNDITVQQSGTGPVTYLAGSSSSLDQEPNTGTVSNGISFSAGANISGRMTTLYGTLDKVFIGGNGVGNVGTYYANYIAKPVISTSFPGSSLGASYAFVSEPGSGPVGINTVTPAHDLEVVGTEQVTNLIVTGTCTGCGTGGPGGGAPNFPVSTKTTNYTATSVDFASCTLLAFNAPIGAVLTLPSTMPANGQCIKVMNYGAPGSAVVTVLPSGHTVNGISTINPLIDPSSVDATQGNGAMIYSDGIGYFMERYTPQPTLSDVLNPIANVTWNLNRGLTLAVDYTSNAGGGFVINESSTSAIGTPNLAYIGAKSAVTTPLQVFSNNSTNGFKVAAGTGNPTTLGTAKFVGPVQLTGVAAGPLAADASGNIIPGTSGTAFGYQGTPTTNAIVTAFDTTHVQTPNAAATLSSAGDLAGLNSLSTGSGSTACGTATGCIALTGGSTVAPGAANSGTIRYDLASNSLKCTANAGAETGCTGASLRTWSYTFSGVCQAGVASAPIFIPSANGWGFACATAYTSSWYLDIANTVESFFVRLLVPLGHTGNYGLTMQYRTSDPTTTNSATLQLSYVCLAAGQDPSNIGGSIAWNTIGTMTLNASSTPGQMVFLTPSLTINPTCADGNDLYFQFVPTANNLASTLNMSLLNFSIQANP